MEESRSSEQYQNKITADQFVQFFLMGDSAFEEWKRGGKVPAGVDRLKFDDPRNIALTTLQSEMRDVTLFENIEVEGEVKIETVIDGHIPSLYCSGCKLSRFAISDSKFVNENEIFVLLFSNCNTGDLWIEEGTQIGTIRVNNSIAENILIRKSCCSDIIISDKSMVKSISAFGKSSTGNIIIERGSNVGSIELSHWCNGGFIRIDNSISGNLSIAHFSTAGAIVIFNTSATGDIEVGNNSQVKDIDIKGNSAAQNIRIVHTCITGNIAVDEKSAIGNFQTHKSFMGAIAIANSTAGSIDIQNNTTVRSFTIQNSMAGDFSISNFCSTGDLNVSGHSKIGNINIEKNSITGNICIDASETGNFTAEQLHCSIFLTAAKLLIVQLFNCKIHCFKMNLACKLEAYINSGQVNLIDLRKTTLSKESILSFSETAIYALLMEAFGMMGNLYFRQITKADQLFNWPDIVDENYRFADKKIAKNPALVNFNTERLEILEMQKESYEANGIRLKKEVPEASIQIVQSSLGKAEFFDCPLAEFSIVYNNSKITECFILGGSIPNKNVSVYNAEWNSVEFHKQKASYFSQLKKIFEGQGDIYRATQFQVEWAKHQECYLKKQRKQQRRQMLKNGVKEKISLYFNETSQDIYSLWLNKFSNNHGESWFRAFVLLLASAVSFYLMYLWSIGPYLTRNNFNSGLVGYFFEYLNPIHKSNFLIEPAKASGLTVFIDFTGRLLIAYFTYQFIAAFRKHSRKQ